MATFDWKYGERDWRKDQVETFQNDFQQQTQYVVVDGEIVQTIEETMQYVDPLAGVPADPIAGPPYLFIDGTYRRDVSESVLLTHRIITTFDEISDDSYRVTIRTRNLQSGETARSVQIITGKRPAAPTRQSGLTALRQEPIISTMMDDDGFVPRKEAVNLPWAETMADVLAATRRRMQRNSAILWEYETRYNPLIRLGHTVRVICATRGINDLGIVVSRTVKISGQTGEAKLGLRVEKWKP